LTKTYSNACKFLVLQYLLWGKLFAENSHLTSVVSLSNCYFQQKPSPQKQWGSSGWKKKYLDHDLSRNEIEQVSESRWRSFFLDNCAALLHGPLAFYSCYTSVFLWPLIFQSETLYCSEKATWMFGDGRHTGSVRIWYSQYL